ncbi:MAG: hypothetical protein ACI9WU_004980 [Myxococcota bacterium]|jgi:hypothetical protein
MKYGISMKVAALTALLALGCDPLVGGQYQGQTLLSVEGTVRDTTPLDFDQDELDESGASLRIAVFWSRGDVTNPAADNAAVSLLEEQAVATGVFPSAFRIAIHSPPPEAAMLPNGDGDAAIGLLVLFLDKDNDTRWDPTVDQLVGGLEEWVLVYARGAASLEGTGTLAAGYQMLEVEAEDNETSDRCKDGVVEYEVEDPHGVQVVIDLSNPALALFDTDCDGDTDEYDHLLGDSD